MRVCSSSRRILRGKSLNNRSRKVVLAAAALGALPLVAAQSRADSFTFTSSAVAGGGTYSWSGGAASGWSSAGGTYVSAPVPNSDPSTVLNFVGVNAGATTTSYDDVANPFQLSNLSISGAGPTTAAGIGTLVVAGGQLNFVTSTTTGLNPTIELTATGSLATTGGSLNTANYLITNNINLVNDTTVSGSGTAYFVLTGQLSGSGQLIKTGTSNLVLGTPFNNTTASPNESFTYTGNITVNSGGTVSLGFETTTGTDGNEYDGLFTTGTLTLNGGVFQQGYAPVVVGYVNNLGSNTGALFRPTSAHDAFVIANIVGDNVSGVPIGISDNFVADNNGATLSLAAFTNGQQYASLGTGTVTIPGIGTAPTFASIGTTVLSSTGTGVNSAMTNNNSATLFWAGTTDLAPNPGNAASSFTMYANDVAVTATNGSETRVEGASVLRLDANSAGTMTVDFGTTNGTLTNQAMFTQYQNRGVLTFQAAQGLSSLGTRDNLQVIAGPTGAGTIASQMPLGTDNILGVYLTAADGTGAGTADFVTYSGTGTNTDLGLITATTAYNESGTLTLDNGNKLTNYSSSLTTGSLTTNIVELNVGGGTLLSSLGAGSYSAAALRIDTENLSVPSGGSVNLGQGTLGYSAAGFGQSDAGLILNGAAISGAGTLAFGNSTAYIYTDASNGTISSNVTGGTLVKDGPGTLFLATPGTAGFTGIIQVNGGALDIGTVTSTSSRLANGAFLYLYDGVLEGNGTFTRALASGGTGIEFGQGSGFAANGGSLTVNLGGASAPLTWGTNYFNVSPVVATAFVYSNGATPNYYDYTPFVFGAPTANGQVIFQNPIALGATSPFYWRDIDVLSGLGGDSAMLTGVISDTAGAVGTHGILKDGPGTLYLTGANTYAGNTAIVAGTLYANNTSGSGTGGGSISINGGTFGGTGTVTGPVFVNPNGTLKAGVGGGNGVFSTGAVNFGGGTFSVAINSTAQTSDELNSGAGTVSLNGLAALSVSDLNPSALTSNTFILIASTTPVVGTFAGLPNNSTVLVGGNSYTLNYNVSPSSGTDYVELSDIGSGSSTPEPASGAMILGGATVGLLRRRRRSQAVSASAS